MGSNRALPLVAVGGIIGALLRWLILDLSKDTADLQSFSVLGINIAGAAIIGWLAGKGFDPELDYDKENEHSSVWPLVAVGFCGGLTSFAAFTLDIAQRLRDGDLANAATLTVLSVVLITAAAGFMWRRAWARNRGEVTQ